MHEHDPDEFAVSVMATLRKAWKKVKGFCSWAKHRILHKLEHVKLNNLLDILSKHGVALVIIIVGWEIIEDVLFPLLFIWLGNSVHPAFLAGAPAAWLICLHWLVVPLTWSFWIKISGQKKNKTRNHDDECC